MSIESRVSQILRTNFCVIQKLEAVAKEADSRIAALEAELTEVKRLQEITCKIERQYTDRWMAAWEKFRKAKDNAEATTVFREFLNEKFSDERISETVKQLSAAEAKLQEVTLERDQARNAILQFGSNPAGFDWAFLSRLEDAEAKLQEHEKTIACYAKHLGEICDYGTDAASLDKQLREWVQRAREAEAKLVAVRERRYRAKKRGG